MDDSLFTELCSEINTLETEVRKLEDHNLTLSYDVSSLKEKHSKLEGECDQYIQREKEIEDLKEKRIGMNNEYDSVKEQVNKKISECTKVNEELDKILNENTECCNEYAKNKQDPIKNGTRKKEYEKKIKKLEGELENHNKEELEIKKDLKEGQQLKDKWHDICSKARELEELCEMTKDMLEADGPIVKSKKLSTHLNDESRETIEIIRQIAKKEKAYLNGAMPENCN